jgi:hypothetical protein
MERPLLPTRLLTLWKSDGSRTESDSAKRKQNAALSTESKTLLVAPKDSILVFKVVYRLARNGCYWFSAAVHLVHILQSCLCIASANYTDVNTRMVKNPNFSVSYPYFHSYILLWRHDFVISKLSKSNYYYQIHITLLWHDLKLFIIAIPYIWVYILRVVCIPRNNCHCNRTTFQYTKVF